MVVSPVAVTALPFASKVPAEFVRVPETERSEVESCRVPAPEWRMLLKAVPPELSVCVPELLSKVTVPELASKVPLVLDQLPLTVKSPKEGAVSVPDEIVTFPFTSRVVLPPENVPPEIVSPPSKVWVASPVR